ncbi:Alpha/Beta hydrolase protein [Bisporella sp. PMI_857]|nr:Alpha/Beta hydrolase protein [Bisporella sp. PMI_857]
MAPEKEVAPYGTWTSPITSHLISGSSNSFSEVHVHPGNGTIYVVEGRPAEGGKSTILQIKDGKSEDILPKEYDVRSRVHEYGGGAAAVAPDGTIIFTDAKTNGVFRFKSQTEIESLVIPHEYLRFADFDAHPTDAGIILAVREDHRNDIPENVINTVVAIDTRFNIVRTICQGADFYTHPKFSKDGKWISWVEWKHPDMPWTGTELYAAEWADGGIGKPRLIAGKPGKEAVSQPKWHSYGGLLYLSDQSGYHQLYMWDPTSFQTKRVEIKDYRNVDLSVTETLGSSSTYAELSPSTLVVTYTREAVTGILLVGIASGQVIDLPVDLVDISRTGIRRISDTSFVAIATSSTEPQALYRLVFSPPSRILLRESTTIHLPPSIFSRTRSITFPRTQGRNPEGNSYAMFTPPHNPGFKAPEGSKPPLIVSIHGGPTGNSTLGLDLQTQYWTSRGYAHVAVNYAGSTGYGRAYWESLNYSWGIKDVDDAASCVFFLANSGLIDISRVGIMGRSAGGYTVLNALEVYPRLYAGGNCLFGVGNLRSLAYGTHKYESHYLFALLFPPDTPVEEQKKIYWERSPCHHPEKIESPLLLQQGDIDKVVPMEQAIEMEKVLRKQGKDVKLIIYKGEGHGFKMEEHIRQSIEEAEALWSRTLVRQTWKPNRCKIYGLFRNGDWSEVVD